MGEAHYYLRGTKLTKFDDTGVIIHENRLQALVTLASETALIVGTKLAMTDAFRMLKSEIVSHIFQMTAGEGGRLALYLCHGDLSVAEISDALSGDGPLSRGDIEASMRAKRPIFLAGQYDADEVGTTAHLTNIMTGGHGSIMKPRWTFPDGGVGWNWVVYNFSSTALTTGAVLIIQNKAYGLWVGA